MRVIDFSLTRTLPTPIFSIAGPSTLATSSRLNEEQPTSCGWQPAGASDVDSVLVTAGAITSAFAPKIMKLLLASLILCTLSGAGHAEEQAWSEPVNGLRARLSLERQKDTPFLKIFLELQNTSDVAGIKTVRFTPSAIAPIVTNNTGQELPRANGAYDGMSPMWTPLTVPFEGTLRFRISFPGLGYKPSRDTTIIDLGSQDSWSIPKDGEWFLSASVKIDRQSADHASKDWSGTLSLPKIRIPSETKGEQDGTGQPATRPESKSEGSDKPQPEAEGRSR